MPIQWFGENFILSDFAHFRLLSCRLDGREHEARTLYCASTELQILSKILYLVQTKVLEPQSCHGQVVHFLFAPFY